MKYSINWYNDDISISVHSSLKRIIFSFLYKIWHYFGCHYDERHPLLITVISTRLVSKLYGIPSRSHDLQLILDEWTSCYIMPCGISHPTSIPKYSCINGDSFSILSELLTNKGNLIYTEGRERLKLKQGLIPRGTIHLNRVVDQGK